MPNNEDLSRYPLGSNAFPVFDKNVRNLDVAVNDKENECWKDRFGKMRRTWHGMESNFDRFIDASSEEFQQFLINSGYQDMGDYGPGLEITARNQVFVRDGNLYRASANLVLPYTTSGDWEDEGDNFVIVGDESLRQELGDPNKGSELIAYLGGKSVKHALKERAIQVKSVTQLRQTEPEFIGQTVWLNEYHEGTGYGQGLYVSVDPSYSESDCEVTNEGSVWKIVTQENTFSLERLGAIKDDPLSVKDAFIRAIDCVKEKGFGTVFVGPGEWVMEGFNLEVNASDITFHFSKGCHFKMGYTLLGWYPIDVGVGHKNVKFTGEGIIEALPNSMWHNDMVFVKNINVSGLTFVNPIVSGHFLDLMGCEDVSVENITVLGSNIERPIEPRLFSEFIQVSTATTGGMGWPAMREKYADFVNGEPTKKVSLYHSKFRPYNNGSEITYPPRPIGDHGSRPTVSGITISDCEFENIIRQDTGGRSFWLEIPTSDNVLIQNNLFILSDDHPNESSIRMIAIRGEGGSGARIGGNTFILKRPGNRYLGVVSIFTHGSVDVSDNMFNIDAVFSDAINIEGALSGGHLAVDGNMINSSGRRFCFVDSPSRLLDTFICNDNQIIFTTENTDDYRHPVDIHSSRSIFQGNTVRHPGVFGYVGRSGPSSVNGNMFYGAGGAISIASGLLTGNVFNTSSDPSVTIGGVAQTSNGWNFVKV